MRELNKIIIHCSDTYSRMDVGVKEIDKWHKDRGFSEIGYHFVIKRDGTTERGRDIEKIGAHCKEQNNDSIGICVIGGKSEMGTPEDNFAFRQIVATRNLITYLRLIFPEIKEISPHSEYSNYKTCPNFDIYDRLDIEKQ